MKLLALDTCSLYGSLALVNGRQVMAELTTLGVLNRNEQLFPLLEQLLAVVGWGFETLDGFVVTRGPGSFTGLRVGIATIQGLALATGKPAWGLNSLEAMAWGLPGASVPVCPVLDARKQEVYTALYQWQGGALVTLAPAQVVRPEVFVRQLAGPVLLLGDGAGLMEEALRAQPQASGIRVQGTSALIRASVMADAVLTRLEAGQQALLEPPTPVYLRASEAELKLGPSGPVVPLASLEGPQHS